VSTSFVTTLMACYGGAVPDYDSGVHNDSGTMARPGALISCDINGDGDCDDPGERPPQ